MQGFAMAGAWSLPSPELGSSVTLGLWPCHFLSQPLDFSMHEMQKLLSDLEARAKQAIKKSQPLSPLTSSTIAASS